MGKVSLGIGLTAVTLLFVWVLGLFWIPETVWLAPFAEGDAEPLAQSGEEPTPGSPTHVVPARGATRPGRYDLGSIRLQPGKSKLLRLRVGPSKALTLEIERPGDGKGGRRQRLPPTEDGMEHQVVLTASRQPETLRLTLWNRARSQVIVDSARVENLARGFEWARPAYWLVGLLIVAGAGWRLRAEIRRYFGKAAPGAVSSSFRRQDHLAAATVFVLCFLTFRSAPVHQLLDAKYMTVVSHALLTTGSVALPENFTELRRPGRSYTLRRVGDEVFHSFSSAPGILGAPVVAMFAWLGIRPVGPEGEYLGHNEIRILRFQAALLAAATCALLFLIARRWLAPGGAVVTTLVFAFGTQLFSTVSRPFWSHSWAILLLTAAMWILVSPAVRERAWAYAVVATLLSWAYFCRPSLALAIVGITLFLWFDRRPALMPFLGAGAIWIVALMVYARLTFESLLPPYLWSSHLASGRLATELFVRSYPAAVLGTLASPGRGLFVYLPFLLIVLVALIRYWRWIPDHVLGWTAVGVCVAHWQLVSCFRNWWGGQSFGPRLMSDLIPWLFVLTIFAVVAVRDSGRMGARRWRRSTTLVTAVTVALAIFIHTRGAWVQETQRGAGIWNWRYPQFLAGLLDRPDDREHRSPQ